MNDPSSDHLAWLALQYVCDELGDDDRAEFELLLAEDQAVREAVAAAVEECAAMRVVFQAWAEGVPQVIATSFPVQSAAPAEAPTPEPTTASRKKRLSWRRAAVAAAWMTAGAAASLLALALLPDRPADQQPTTAAIDGDSAALARAYVASEAIETQLPSFGALTEWSWDPEAGVAVGDDTFITPAGELATLDAADDAATGLAEWETLRVEPLVPAADDWMLALVASDMSAAEGAPSDGETKN